MVFLLSNRDLFQCNRSERRVIKINVLMSQAVGTRSPDQCRSHHQKMMQYHKDITNIVVHIQGLQ
jgi:phosphatidylserine/phosphatidylglycerophosphate/cardiolipin synthase-like enzyme